MARPKLDQSVKEFHTIKFEAEHSLVTDLRREAGARGLSADSLARRLVEVAIQDKIVAAILDTDD